jgi:hypothetical protein
MVPVSALSPALNSLRSRCTTACSTVGVQWECSGSADRAGWSYVQHTQAEAQGSQIVASATPGLRTQQQQPHAGTRCTCWRLGSCVTYTRFVSWDSVAGMVPVMRLRQTRRTLTHTHVGLSKHAAHGLAVMTADSMITEVPLNALCSHPVQSPLPSPAITHASVNRTRHLPAPRCRWGCYPSAGWSSASDS